MSRGPASYPWLDVLRPECYPSSFRSTDDQARLTCEQTTQGLTRLNAKTQGQIWQANERGDLWSTFIIELPRFAPVAPYARAHT